ncbi:conserved hypothetical protein [Pediculus humanus corporis]|uniref:Uncharacterized protein n=1 Tax=Pediculus humanus subsp. corporis TaxID=121224 RepID=E0VJF7_PEDHC|nr:uncharacterized protein Phum_PHUM244280 [Pediculus humanus corporis]EEB13513.1 conserved hypothetical protein [Pediculus humanus corporis]
MIDEDLTYNSTVEKYESSSNCGKTPKETGIICLPCSQVKRPSSWDDSDDDDDDDDDVDDFTTLPSKFTYNKNQSDYYIPHIKSFNTHENITEFKNSEIVINKKNSLSDRSNNDNNNKINEINRRQNPARIRRRNKCLNDGGSPTFGEGIKTRDFYNFKPDREPHGNSYENYSNSNKTKIYDSYNENVDVSPVKLQSEKNKYLINNNLFFEKTNKIKNGTRYDDDDDDDVARVNFDNNEKEMFMKTEYLKNPTFSFDYNNDLNRFKKFKKLPKIIENDEIKKKNDDLREKISYDDLIPNIRYGISGDDSNLKSFKDGKFKNFDDKNGGSKSERCSYVTREQPITYLTPKNVKTDINFDEQFNYNNNKKKCQTEFKSQEYPIKVQSLTNDNKTTEDDIRENLTIDLKSLTSEESSSPIKSKTDSFEMDEFQYLNMQSSNDYLPQSPPQLEIKEENYLKNFKGKVDEDDDDDGDYDDYVDEDDKNYSISERNYNDIIKNKKNIFSGSTLTPKENDKKIFFKYDKNKSEIIGNRSSMWKKISNGDNNHYNENGKFYKKNVQRDDDNVSSNENFIHIPHIDDFGEIIIIKFSILTYT